MGLAGTERFRHVNGIQNSYWHPEYSELCLCGSDRSFGVCCFPILGGADNPLQDSDALLEEGKTAMAEHHARAAVTRYASWIRQHTALSLNASDREYSEKMIPIDCLALESVLAKLERWASMTGSEDTVSNTYRKLEEVVGVPVIARRLVALGAQWLVMNGRVEEGLLELDRLGTPSELTDTRALLLSIRFGDHEPKEKLRLLEAAARFALDDDERKRALLPFAHELNEQNSCPQALDVVHDILRTTSSSSIVRSATALRWEISGEDKDFKSLVSLMNLEEIDDDRLGAASYLIAKARRDVALDILQTLLENNHPVAILMAVECEIRSGDCAAAGKRFSSIDVDATSAVELRVGFAHLQAQLVLHCGRNDLREAALRELTELSSSEAASTLPELIEALKRHQ